MVVMPASRQRGPESGWLSSAEAARRLGVKRETLYAYVSRGMLTRRKETGSRESRFDPAEIGRLAEGRRTAGGLPGAVEVVIDSALTLLDPSGRLWFRGWDVEIGCRRASFEQVAEWLWTAPPKGSAARLGRGAGVVAAAGPGEAAGVVAAAGTGEAAGVVAAAGPEGVAAAGPAGRPPTSFSAPAAVLTTARRAVASLATGTPLIDRLHVALAAGAAADPRRFDRRPDAVAAAGRRIIAVLVDALPPAPHAEAVPEDATVAERLWSRLCPTSAPPEHVAVLDAALVLLADHEMASSTLAARIAASTWADPYLVVTAGLATLGGPLHGSVGDQLVPMLREAVSRGATEAIAARWRLGEKVWGFGHFVYTDRDPRAEALWLLLQAGWPDSDIVAVTGDVIAAVTAHGATFPNVDLVLAALVGAAGMVDGSAEVIFAVARTVGWIAHAIEEYEHRLRYRLRAAYTGPAPAPGRAPARAR
jgi:citrate synthase